MIEIKTLDRNAVAKRWETMAGSFQVKPFKKRSSDDKSHYSTNLEDTALGDLFIEAGLPPKFLIGSPSFRTAEAISKILDISSFQGGLVRAIASDRHGTYAWLLKDALVNPEKIVGPHFEEIDPLARTIEAFSQEDWGVVQQRVQESPESLLADAAFQVDESARMSLVGGFSLPNQGVDWTRGAFAETLILSRMNTLGFVNHAKDVLHWGPYAATALQIPPDERPPVGRLFTNIFDTVRGSSR